jgi:hypothetical protein
MCAVTEHLDSTLVTGKVAELDRLAHVAAQLSAVVCPGLHADPAFGHHPFDSG